MKKYFIYQDGKGNYFIAKSRNCKHTGDLVGWVKGSITGKEISAGWHKGAVVSLISDERVEIDSYKFYAMQAFKVEAVNEEFYVIARNVNVAVEMVLNSEDVRNIEDVKNVHVIELTEEEMKEVLIPANSDINLFEVFSNYKGKGEIVCSTVSFD